MASTGLPPELFDRVPGEVWTSIFRYTSDRRGDIANARLACKEFHAASSQFLITRVVLAKDTATLQRALDVFEHSFFRHHVTELVYDASRYSGYLAMTLSKYHRICLDDSTRVVFDGKTTTKPLVDGPEQRQRTLSELSQRVSHGTNAHDAPTIRTDGTSDSRNIHRGFIEYSKRWLDQESIVERLLHLETLRKAFSRLPKLRRILYTDFRHRARHREPYADLLNRLFDNVLEPTAAAFVLEDEMVEFLQVLKTINTTSSGCIRSLEIGGHPYEDFETVVELDFSRPIYTRLWGEPPGLPYRFLHRIPKDINDGTEDFEDNESDGLGLENHFMKIPAIVKKLAADLQNITDLKGLSHLRLPVKIPTIEALDGCFSPAIDLPKSHLRRMLQSCQSTLVSLELVASQTDSIIDEDFEEGEEINQGFLKALLDGLTFNKLQHLLLQNWMLPEQAFLEQFFSRHSSTLREVRLLDCSVSNDEDPTNFGIWVGKNMMLAGVELILRPAGPREDLLADITTEDSDSTNAEMDAAVKSTSRAEGEEVAQRSSSAMDGLKEDHASPKDSGTDFVLEFPPEELQSLWLAGRNNSLPPSTAVRYPDINYRLLLERMERADRRGGAQPS